MIYLEHDRVTIDCQAADDGKTQKNFREECNIMNIMANYKRNGDFGHINKSPGNYGDFATALEYTESLNRIIAADADFKELPADLRKRFENDPGRLLDFLQDENNFDEAVELGLVNAPDLDQVPTPIPPPAETAVTEPVTTE